MKPTYQIILNNDGEAHAIKCFNCGLTSYSLEDVRHRFCGKCHIFHDDLRQYAKMPGFNRVLVDSEAPLNPEYLEALGLTTDH